MRLKFITLFVLLLSTVCALKSANNPERYFAPVGAEWYYSEGSFMGFPISENYIKLTSQKDTLVDGINCRKIIKRHKISCKRRPDFELVYNSADTVFFYDPTFNKFQILYIGDAQKGDSWVIETIDESEELDSIVVTVDSTGYTEINEYNINTLYVTYQKIDEFMPYDYTSTIIESIGDVSYMFNWDSWSAVACDGNFSNGLRCYSDAEIGLYSTGIADSCDQIIYWTGTEVNDIKPQVTISPNPATNEVKLLFNRPSLDIELYDLSGKLIKHEHVFTSDILRLNGIKEGYYLLVFKEKNSVVAVKKLVKIR